MNQPLKDPFAETRAEAVKRFTSVPKPMIPILRKVFDEARDRLYYERNPFPKVDLRGAHTVTITGNDRYFGEAQDLVSVEMPKGPGGIQRINYDSLSSIASKQSVENAMRSIIIDGFDMIMPEQLLVEYMRYELSRPAFERHIDVADAHEVMPDQQILNRFEHFLLHLMPLGNMGALTIRDNPDDQRQMLDRSSEKADNFHTRNVLSVYEFLNANPEYAVALFMWTHSMREYCRDLHNLVSGMSEEDQRLFSEAPFWDTLALLTGGNRLLEDTNFSGFFDATPILSTVIGAILENTNVDFENANKSKLALDQVKPSLSKLGRSGIFQRTSTKTFCDFSSF